MTAADYDLSLKRLLVSEGGYTNHPADPGGPTNFGITIADYRKYVKPSATAADVKAMKVEEAKSIYRAKYWDVQRCDDLPSGVDYAIFDYGVNSGIGRSGKVLRRCLNMSDATSVVTADVIGFASAASQADLICAICDERLRFLRSLKTWPVFGDGWGRRVSEVKLAALAMSQKKPPITATQAQGKGVVAVNKAAQAGSAGAVIASGTAVSHVANYNSLVIGLVVIVGVLAIITTAVFISNRQAKQQEAAA